MSNTQRHKAGVIPSTSKANLGLCPTCKQAFSNRIYAIQCCLCQKYYHAPCMNNTEVRDETMVQGVKSMTGNLICTACEQLAQKAVQESSAMQTQMEKLQRKLRALEAEAEKKRLAVEHRIASLTQQ